MPPCTAIARASAGSLATSSLASVVKKRMTSRPETAVTRNSTPAGSGFSRTTNPGGGLIRDTLDPARMPSVAQSETTENGSMSLASPHHGEGGKVAAGLLILHHHALHARGRRPATAPGDQLVHLCPRSLHQRLHLTAGQVPHPPAHAQLGCPLAGALAEEHALDASFDPQADPALVHGSVLPRAEQREERRFIQDFNSQLLRL